MASTAFADLHSLAEHLRATLNQKAKFVLLYAHNGTGKTRLCGEFKRLGKTTNEDGTRNADTLYYNAFTEDLFWWDNDLEQDLERVLRLNQDSRFFAGLRELEMDVKIGQLLERYVDFSFYIDYEGWAITFFYERQTDGSPIPIKISRGEESIFIWCFFLAILQLALDDHATYNWVHYVFIDDPISSLDEHNAIVVGNHLVQMYRDAKRHIPTVISTHHALFFNVVHYEIRNHLRDREAGQYVLARHRPSGAYVLEAQRGDTPQFYHVSALKELWQLAQQDQISTYHFNVLRSLLEKTAFFHGYGHFSRCIGLVDGDPDGVLHERFVDILSHGKYSMFEPVAMQDQTRDYFRAILNGFVKRHPFNPALLKSEDEVST